MPDGFFGRVLWVDLTEGRVEDRTLPSELYREYLGGYGLGVRLLYDWMPVGAEPLGPENVLAFLPGLLTGSGVPFSGRFMVAAKSPLTGGWGDSNCGGHFGPALRSAGLDGVFFTGESAHAVYLLIDGERAELVDATHLWGSDAKETDRMIKQEAGEDLQVAAVGPAGENGVLFAAIIASGSRAGARSGLGAVMGSKRLKALAVRGSQRAPLHDRAELVRLARQYGRVLRPSKSRLPGLLFGMSRMVLPLLRALRFKPSGGPTAAIVQVYRDYGTCSGVALATEIGDIPVRNWSGVGTDDLPLQRSSLISDDAVIQHQVRRYYCRHCAVGCGGFVRLESERFGLQEGRKPEFETLGAFGPLLLNDDLESIITAGNICDRQGMDTISTGAVVAFAIECAEKGLISREDAGGLDLSWGNGEAIVELVEMIARREGIGDLLAEGVRRASARIGGGADAFAMHAGGQELPMHDTRYEPLVAVGYQVDATPGRHTASMSGLIDNAILREAIAAAGIRPPGRYEVEGKGRVLAAVNQLLHVLNCSGLCIYAVLMGRPPLREWINAATGWELDVAEMLELGRRVQLTRHAFNAREGLELGDSDLPDRAIGRPPLQRGPLRGVTLDMEAMTQEYYQAVGLDPKTGMPTEDARQALGLDRLLDGSTGTH